MSEIDIKKSERSMARPNAILSHPLYVREYARLQELEKGRAFCCHDLTHFLDVARVCWIQVLEQDLPISKDLVYAAGLLHDIGKGRQYAFGTPHHTAGAELAEIILSDCGYTPAEIAEVTDAIRLHREQTKSDGTLSGILYGADKKTRPCFHCAARKDCNWSEEKKNQSILY